MSYILLLNLGDFTLKVVECINLITGLKDQIQKGLMITITIITSDEICV